jgi:hypothetical protein
MTLIGSTGNVVPGGKYKPNTVYTVSLGGTNTTAAKFGFQITAKKAAGQAGSFIAGSNTHTFTSGGLTGVEHSSPITIVSTTATMPSFTWTAPTGTGDVTFGVIMNAVNGNGNADAGDHASTATFLFHEYNPASVAELSEKIKISAYPNPAVSNVNLKFEDADKGSYNISVVDMRGVPVFAKDAIINSTGSVSIDAGNWAPGMYFVQIEKDEARRVIPIAKQ